MADHAVKMAESGVSSIVVLGVDFMSENVRAVLDAAGHQTVPVYRVSERDIGSLLLNPPKHSPMRLGLSRPDKAPTPCMSSTSIPP